MAVLLLAAGSSLSSARKALGDDCLPERQGYTIFAGLGAAPFGRDAVQNCGRDLQNLLSDLPEAHVKSCDPAQLDRDFNNPKQLKRDLDNGVIMFVWTSSQDLVHAVLPFEVTGHRAALRVNTCKGSPVEAATEYAKRLQGYVAAAIALSEAKDAARMTCAVYQHVQRAFAMSSRALQPSIPAEQSLLVYLEAQRQALVEQVSPRCPDPPLVGRLRSATRKS